MSTTKFSVFAIGGGKFAIGAVDKKAAYVISVKGKKITGVRGRRPVLTAGRYTRVSATPEMREAFKLALGE